MQDNMNKSMIYFLERSVFERIEPRPTDSNFKKRVEIPMLHQTALCFRGPCFSLVGMRSSSTWGRLHELQHNNKLYLSGTTIKTIIS